MSVTNSLDQSELFDDHTASAMSHAFDEAWNAVQQSGLHLLSGMKADQMREILALRIIETAGRGERDPERLKDDALSYLADVSLRKQA